MERAATRGYTPSRVVLASASALGEIVIAIPAIQVRAGLTVTTPEHRDLPTDPTGCALHLSELGARRVHLVNQDAARGIDDPRSRRALRAAVNTLRDAGVTVDISGGIRSRAAAEFWLESGAETAVLGTMAVYRPDIAGEICRAFPGHVMVSLDVQGDLAHADGWLRDAGPATIHLRRWSPWPAAGVIRTASGSAGGLSGTAVASLRQCVDAYSGALIANGDVRTLTDMVQAAATGAAGALINFNDPHSTIDLAEALQLFPGNRLVVPTI